MRVVALIVGLVLTLVVFMALVRAMLVPRRFHNAVTRGVDRLLTALSRGPLTWVPSYERQDRWLAVAAPISVLLQLVVYVVLLIATMGLVVFGTTTLTLNDALNQSGSTLTTLGIVEPVNEASTIATFVAAFLGLVVIAIFIGYLMALYSAYTDREAGTARAAMLAGEPAWGPVILARGHVLGLSDDTVPDPGVWLDWICVTRLNAEVNPVLMRFRATSPHRHWVATLTALVDAAALRICLAGAHPDPRQVQLITEGALTLNVLARAEAADPTPAPRHVWDQERTILDAVRAAPAATAAECGLTRADFDDGLNVLARAGLPAPADADLAWRRFAAIRSSYAAATARLALDLHAVPAPWTGPRRPAMPTQWPEPPVG